MEPDKLDNHTLALLTTLSNLMNLGHSSRHIEQTYRKAIEEVRDLRICEFQPLQPSNHHDLLSR